MNIRLLPILLLVLLTASAPAAEDPETYHLLRVDLDSYREAPKLQALGLDIVKAGPGNEIELVARSSDLDELSKAGFGFETVIEDMASFYEKRLIESCPENLRTFPNGSMSGFYTLSEIETMLDDWAVQYPHLITPKTSIGTSIEGRDIWAVKISDNPNIDEQEPEVSFDSLIHAREPQSMMTLIYYMIQLLEGYGIDAELTWLVDNREIWFIPVHNPDGYVYNEQTNPNGGGMWRKNRRNNGGSYGVDLNRNYGYKWGYDNWGSSPNPGSETYRGTSAFSEPETQAVRDHILNHPIMTSWNTHTYSNLYLCPFGYDNVLPFGGDWAIYQEYLADISADNGYTAGTIYNVLYAANGSATDWHYADAGVFNITPEIGNSGDGFWPSFNRIIPLAEENLLAIKYWSWVAGSSVDLENHTLADDNGDGYYFPGEPVAVTLTLRNKGLAATTTDVTASVGSSSPYVTVVNGTHNFGVIASVTNADNSASPLIVELDSTTPYGESITLDVDVAFEGYTQTLPLSFTAGAPMIWFQDDFETDKGWTVSNQNLQTGAWERDVPNPTSGQQVAPTEDNPNGTGTYCFLTENGPAGGSYSSYDIDGGPTRLISPVIDLSSGNAEVSLYAWYYSRDNNDAFEIDVSNDNGGSWTNVFSTYSSLSGWDQLTFNVADYVTPTAQVRVRAVAQDQPNNDIVEAGLDDVEVKTYASPIGLALSAPPVIGTTVNIIIDSPDDAGLGYIMAASTDTYPAVPIGDGRFFPLEDNTILRMSINPGNGIFNFFTGTLDGSGQSSDPEFVIPNMPGIVGREVFFAAVTQHGAYPQGVKNISAPLATVLQ